MLARAKMGGLGNDLTRNQNTIQDGGESRHQTIKRSGKGLEKKGFLWNCVYVLSGARATLAG